MEATLKLARLIRYARKRANSPGEVNAEKWRHISHLAILVLGKAVAGELAPERLETLDKHFERYALDGRNDGGSGSGNWGHEGRPGKLGGSAPGGGAHNRMTAEGGGFTLFAKMKKSLAKEHTATKEDFKAACQEGTKVLSDGLVFVYNSKANGFIDVGAPLTTPFYPDDFIGERVKILLSDKNSPNYSNSKGMTVEGAKKKFQSVFTPGSEQEADDAYRAKSGEVWRNSDQGTKKALYSYTGSGYGIINKALRAGHKGSSYTAEKIDRMTEAIGRSKLDKDCVLYRGLGIGAFEKMMRMEKGTLTPKSVKDLVGRPGDDKGFMSAGSMRDTGFDHKKVNMEILAPKGTQALYANRFPRVEKVTGFTGMAHGVTARVLRLISVSNLKPSFRGVRLCLLPPPNMTVDIIT